MRKSIDMTEPEIGAELVCARADNVPWKVLMVRYGYGRTRLWMLWRAASAPNKDVHEHLGGSATAV